MANSNQDNRDRGKQDGKGSSGGSQQSGTSNRGFASMDPDKQRDIAAEGGRAAHASGNAHEFTSQEAREAGHLSHKNDGNQGGSGNQQSGSGSGNQGRSTGGTRGGTPEQHAEAGRQSHKNDRK